MSTPSRPRALLVALATTLAVMAGVATTSHPRPAAAAASAHDFTDPVFSADARGDITTIGNVTTTCDPTYANANWTAAESAAACGGATSGETGLTR